MNFELQAISFLDPHFPGVDRCDGGPARELYASFVIVDSGCFKDELKSNVIIDDVARNKL